MSKEVTVHQCECAQCQQNFAHPDQQLHQQINLFFSRLDEQQRRWFAALQATQVGQGGNRLVSNITGLSLKTIRRGRHELAQALANRPLNRVRLPGGGRLPTEKKILPCKQP